MYEINLTDGSIIAGPLALPDELVGLDIASLADLSAALAPCPERWRGRGFWPPVGEAVDCDPATQRLSGRHDAVPDPVARVVRIVLRVVDWTPEEVEAADAERIAFMRRSKVAEIDAERDRRLRLGALHQGKRFSMSDASRTDLSGMATTAGLVLLGALTWPEKFAQGWIAMDNSRLPLPTPADGIALSAKASLDYSALVQHARDLKDAALAAEDPATVDELAGWPD